MNQIDFFSESCTINVCMCVCMCVCVFVCVFVCVEMSELLFECYCVPRVAYGIDALFSYSYNAAAADDGCHGDDDALIVSCGYHSTHIIPVLRGRLCASACQRINVGGAVLDAFMQRVLQLKYPQHFTTVTLNRAEVSSVITVLASATI